MHPLLSLLDDHFVVSWHPVSTYKTVTYIKKPGEAHVNWLAFVSEAVVSGEVWSA